MVGTSAGLTTMLLKDGGKQAYTWMFYFQKPPKNLFFRKGAVYAPPAGKKNGQPLFCLF
jgi:hypothetical protein